MLPIHRVRNARTVLSAALLGPVFVIFVSSNLVNAGNLLFNVLFSRWMGPELFGELATVLTIKLALLGILGALQIAVSYRVARESEAAAAGFFSALWQLNQTCFVALWLILPVIVGLVWYGDLASVLGLGSPVLLVLLVLSLPFAVPMSILRGVAYGRLDTRHVLLSANIEMLVRLAGAVLAWKLGFGLVGVVAAVALSIAAGWAPLAKLLDKGPRNAGDWTGLGRTIVIAALPFGILQASQVILLDGDVIVARVFLDAGEAGYIAALSLFQRIQFFACFGLASVLLPAVSRALAEGRSALAPLLAVTALFGCVSAVVLIVSALAPELTISLFVGDSFLPAAPLLIVAATSAVAFTLSYLVATYLSATGDHSGIWIIGLACPLQIGLMSLGAESLEAMLSIKLACQGILTLALLFTALWRTLHPSVPASKPILT